MTLKHGDFGNGVKLLLVRRSTMGCTKQQWHWISQQRGKLRPSDKKRQGISTCWRAKQMPVVSSRVSTVLGRTLEPCFIARQPWKLSLEKRSSSPDAGGGSLVGNPRESSPIRA